MKGYRTANSILDHTVIIIFLIGLLIGIYITADMLYVFQHAEGEIDRFKPDVINAETLRTISGDTVGWITMDDTKIDYPIVQGKTNVEYLNKDPQGNYSLSGSIFMDFRCNPDFEDDYSLVYGHHMVGDLMFGALDRYIDPEYAKKHETGTLYTRKGEYPVMVLGYAVTKVECNEIFDTVPCDREKFLRSYADYYFKENETGKILALTTCKDPATTDRTALFLAVTTKQ